MSASRILHKIITKTFSLNGYKIEKMASVLLRHHLETVDDTDDRYEILNRLVEYVIISGTTVGRMVTYKQMSNVLRILALLNNKKVSKNNIRNIQTSMFGDVLSKISQLALNQNLTSSSDLPHFLAFFEAIYYFSILVYLYKHP